MIHSSIGTGSLAYVVGSKVMDVRAPSKEEDGREAKVEHRQTSFDNTNKVENYCDRNNNCTDTSYACQQESSSDSVDLVSLRESTDSVAYDSSSFIRTSGPHDCSSPKPGSEADETKHVPQSYFDFPPLPVADLFGKCEEDKKEGGVHDDKVSPQRKSRSKKDSMHSFQVNNNVDLVIESNCSPSKKVSRSINSEIELVSTDAHQSVTQPNNMGNKTEMVNRLKISDVPETEFGNTIMSQGEGVNEDRVSEWLWTLHRIGKFSFLSYSYFYLRAFIWRWEIYSFSSMDIFKELF